MVGLCIALYDISHISDSYLFPGDGSTHTKVTFRFIVFRPFIDEVIIGEVRSSSPDGIRVSLGFFDDIIITAENMPQPSRFDYSQQLWAWEYETEEEGKNDLFIDKGQKIRLKVIKETFIELSPQTQANTTTTTTTTDTEHTTKESPYTISGTINDSGLGLLSWWTAVE
jgi:DNA-directed RNA polymerase III subunit RPC8